MYVNKSTCENDLRDRVHLAMVIASQEMVLAMCACSRLSSNYTVWNSCFFWKWYQIQVACHIAEKWKLNWPIKFTMLSDVLV